MKTNITEIKKELERKNAEARKKVVGMNQDVKNLTYLGGCLLLVVVIGVLVPSVTGNFLWWPSMMEISLVGAGACVFGFVAIMFASHYKVI